MTLIRNTLLCALLLMLAYAGLLQAWRPRLTLAPSTALTNRLFVENYAYGKPAPNVLVGSSMSQRISSASLGPAFTNLALSGGSALTGLAILADSPAQPRRVFIEINRSADGADEKLLHATFDEPGFTARRHIAALRKSYQPLSLVYGLLRGRNREQQESDLNAAQRRGLIATTRAQLAVPVPAGMLAARMEELKTLVAKVRARGIEPVFYEMPIEPGLEDSVQMRQVRNAVHAAFPAACWLTLDPPGGAHTNDGLHLQLKDAAAVGAILRALPGCAGR
jgi:hypothetical protein